MLGGFNQWAGGVLSRTFTDLPEHNKLYIGIELWLIDSWDEYLLITIDKVIK